MTSVIENRYWGLKVYEDRFEVGLSFNQVPAKLHIPYAAVTAFVDPAVNFALQFQAQDDEADLRLDEKERAENDGPPEPSGDGWNVVAGDFKRKKRAEERRDGKEGVSQW